jgi:hypothetical protein
VSPTEDADADEDEDIEDFFDPSFLAELEGLAAQDKGAPVAPVALEANLGDKLAKFLGSPPVDEDGFVALPGGALHERTDVLIEICRQGPPREAVQAVENFVVFFQALVPTLIEESADDIKRFFFRLVPTLIHIAYKDFGNEASERTEGVAALRNVETILIEISNVKLAPSERELVFKNIDQLSAFIAVGEYAMANEAISSQLLGIIRGNKITRALFRLMEVEANVQVFLKERLGYLTPQIKIPGDIESLADYGPIRVLEEEEPEGPPRRFLQIQIPEIPILRDIVLRLVNDESGQTHDFRLDALGSTELAVPPGTYSLGLVYQPE